MLKRILLSLVIPCAISACVAEHHRPAVVAPAYVASCPAGYRYDGNACRRIYSERHVEVQVSPH
jgi:hypothetical protein